MESVASVGSSMIDMVPFINPPMYPSLTCMDVSPKCRSTVCAGLVGLGPVGLAKDEKPLPLETNIFLPVTFIFVGYQPTGIKPFERLLPGVDTSNTARQLLSALATYKVFSLADKASP